MIPGKRSKLFLRGVKDGAVGQLECRANRARRLDGGEGGHAIDQGILAIEFRTDQKTAVHTDPVMSDIVGDGVQRLDVDTGDILAYIG